MRKLLWFPKITDIGNSDSRSGRPVSQLIDFTVNTAFPIQESRITELRALRWVEEVNRHRGGQSIQLIVRCRELPPHLAGANSHETFRAELATILCG